MTWPPHQMTWHASKQVTSPPWNSRRQVHSKEVVWASRWSVALRTFYRQILSLLYSSFFFWNFRPRLARELLVYGISLRTAECDSDFNLQLPVPPQKVPLFVVSLADSCFLLRICHSCCFFGSYYAPEISCPFQSCWQGKATSSSSCPQQAQLKNCCHVSAMSTFQCPRWTATRWARLHREWWSVKACMFYSIFVCRSCLILQTRRPCLILNVDKVGRPCHDFAATHALWMWWCGRRALIAMKFHRAQKKPSLCRLWLHLSVLLGAQKYQPEDSRKILERCTVWRPLSLMIGREQGLYADFR